MKQKIYYDRRKKDERMKKGNKKEKKRKETKQEAARCNERREGEYHPSKAKNFSRV